MAQPSLANGVHLVGSIPLSDGLEVFKTLSAELPGRLLSIPDGEIGDRFNYIGHSGVFTLDDVKPTEYDQVAKGSYQNFLQLRQEGVIPRDVRFQVSIPAPYECIQGHVRPEFQAQLEPFYETRIFDALKSILSAIPAEDLAIQLDMCFVVTVLEYESGRLSGDFFKPHFSPIRQGLLDRAQKLCAHIPSNIPLGWHLCYGDLGHKHFIEPEDMSVNLSWVHMPVPKSRDDPAYFEALKRLSLGDKTKLYLGLVHANDEEGTHRRLQAAQSIIPGKDFGIATEFGMGRTPKEDLTSILQISKSLTRAVESSL